MLDDCYMYLITATLKRAQTSDETVWECVAVIVMLCSAAVRHSSQMLQSVCSYISGEVTPSM